ncbi:MAG: hypothetical protein K2P48_09110 [Lachnospiraceae bacterium]|nr:hypothetical protein [Lachnospiraceae bacterium]
MKDGRELLFDNINKAEKVLVGLGEEFQFDWSTLLEDCRYQEIEKEIGGREEYIWIVPFLQKMVLAGNKQNKWKTAYDNLGELLKDKDYFIVSLCMDDYIYTAGYDESRIVTPCGGFRKMQCDQNCCHILSDIPEESYDAVMQYYRKEISIKDLHEPVCTHCGSKQRFNQLGVTKYAEEGYSDSWERYTKWLQGTINRELCVLELGVGMEYPTVIRFPFEKIVYYNQKSFLYRIHSKLHQVGEEISDRGTGIQADAIEFIG